MSETELGKKGNSTENETNPFETSNESKGTDETREHKKDESDEDIPGDFFDDFLKEDFMAGLDIVDDDEWDEEKIKLGNETVEKSTKSVDTSATRSSQIDSSKKRKKVEGKVPVKEKPRSKQKKKKNEEQELNRKHKRNIDADEFDIRRDPEKTKRDIARDKFRCERDKEMKIISEKLNLVETGLVPPGMEMEIDIEEIKKQKEKIETKSPRDLREVIKDIKGRNKSPIQKVKSPFQNPSSKRDLEKSPLRRRKLPTSNRKRSRSPRKDSATLRHVSPRRSPFRKTSPRRSPHRISPKQRSSERLYGRRRTRSPSPIYRNRRKKYSPYRHRNRSVSRESDREKWLKNRHKSRSPRRKRDEKKSFLQEIAEKLNEFRQPVNIMPPLQQMQPMLQPMQPTLTYVQPQSLPIPVPAPVPPPNNGQLFPDPPQQHCDPYDQNFFIGSTQPATLNDFSIHSQPSPLPTNIQIALNPSQSSNLTNIIPSNIIPNAINIADVVANFSVSKNQTKRLPQTQEDVAKLFQDKQISLSEFLAITAKPEVLSASPTHLQEKIKVITRCHEAIKILASSENKYSGKLFVHKAKKIEPVTDKHVSPLKSAPPVLFPFTNPSQPPEQQKYSFTNFINELLQKLGLLKETVVDVDEEPPQVAAIVHKIETVKAPLPPPPLLKPFSKSFSKQINHVRYNNFQDNRLCKMVQTDVFKCESCEKRKKILYRSLAMQTIQPPITFSVGTQVTDEDINPKIPKTQSLAALTPAQLLAKSRESLNAATRSSRIDTDNFDIQPTNYNRSIYGLPRSNPPPFPNSSMSLYETLSSHMSGVGSHMFGVGSYPSGGGGGRLREPFGPRTKDPNIRFTYNNYY